MKKFLSYAAVAVLLAILFSSPVFSQASNRIFWLFDGVGNAITSVAAGSHRAIAAVLIDPETNAPLDYSSDPEHSETASNTGPQMMGYASSSAPNAVSNGDAVRLWATTSGALNVADGGSTLSIDDGGGSITVDASSLPLPTGAATAANQSTIISSLSAIAGLFADPCFKASKTAVAISQVANTQIINGTASNRIYICSIVLTQDADSEQTFSLVNGTGTTCGTNTAAMIGATTAANGVRLPFALGNGLGTIAKSTADGANVCLFQSGSDRLAGVVTYVVAAN